VNRSSIEDGASSGKLTLYGQRSWGGSRPLIGDTAEMVAVHLKDRRVMGVAEASACWGTLNPLYNQQNSPW
jgi:hypothetical protein